MKHARASELLRGVRRYPERRLHVWRRQHAAARLRDLGAPRSVLFICDGNICRSPYAEAALYMALSASLKRELRVMSAGLFGAGRAPPREAVAVAGLRGIDLAGHRSRIVTPEMARDAGIIVVMNARQHRALRQLAGTATRVVVLGDLDPEPIDRRAIRDPVDQPEEVFEAVYSRIDRCLRSLAEAIEVAYRRPG